jgi:hypothetical protein
MVNFRIKPGTKQPDDKIWRMCQKKIRYETEEEADKVLHHKRRKMPAPNRMTLYKCPVCSGYHIGHRGSDWKKPEES